MRSGLPATCGSQQQTDVSQSHEAGGQHQEWGKEPKIKSRCSPWKLLEGEKRESAREAEKTQWRVGLGGQKRTVPQAQGVTVTGRQQ